MSTNMVCRRHSHLAMAGKGLGILSDVVRWRTFPLSGYQAKVALIFNLIITQTLSIPVSTQNRDRHLFRDETQYEFVNSLTEYEISHPHRVTSDGDFLSHHVHHRIRRDTTATWRASEQQHSTDTTDQKREHLHYKLNVGGDDLHLTLRPNYKLLAPDVILEHRKYNFGNVSDSVITRFEDELCHFIGQVEGHSGSAVALGTCYGLHGLLHTNKGAFFIEPIKGHDIKSEGGHPHIIYKRSALPTELDISRSHDHHHGNTISQSCGVKDDEKGHLEREEWEKLRKGSDTTETNVDAPSSHSRHKRSVSLERYVEAMVVIDDRMYKHYENDDLKNYVLTIMNMVTIMYHENSIGNDVNIVLVRLVMGKIEIEKFIEEYGDKLKDKTEEGFEVTHHAEKTLNSFCKWQKEINPPNDHPNHHDVAILMTRYNICSKRNAPCSTLGLAHVSGLCQPHRSCNVNEDTGLALAYTVAHEVGHNFGMQHDKTGSSCTTDSGSGVQLVMAPVLNGASPLVWSNCSKNAITKFLDRDWGYCLNDEPKKSDFPNPQRPPGIIYDANHQCKLQYGPKAAHCDIDDVCKTLWCNVNNRCVTRLEAAAQGTICSPNKWCLSGDCVPISASTPEQIYGEWGIWGGWTGCSRTCGAGVSIAERFCDNPRPSNGGKYCLGERKRYRICNTETCAEDAPGFRAVQCSEFDSVPYKDKLHTWETIASYENACQLHCKPKGEFFSVVMRDMVTDGTPCKLGRRDMCISGKCRTIGCDWVIDSEAKEDSCGVCHGDGTMCTTVKSAFNEESGSGYVEATVIPRGARNIRVEEVAEASNYLAVANDKGQYYLNGYWFIQWSGDYDAGGTILHYKRDGNKESFYAPGPLKEDIHIMLLFQSQNPGVIFEYTVPNENATVRRVPVFFWKYLPWTHCTSSCGGGEQRRIVVCVEKEAGIVDDFYCNISSKSDDMQRVCNDHLCPARWWVGPWQHCSVSCGDNGIHHRTVMCVRSHGQSEQQALDDYECEAQEKPASIEPCHHKDSCPDDWQAGPWSDCIGTCGKGLQTRNVTCLGLNQCHQEQRPIESKYCYLGPCPNSKSIDTDDQGGKSTNKQYIYNEYKYPQGPGDDPLAGVGSASQDLIGQVGHFKDRNTMAEEKPENNEDLYKWLPMEWQECNRPCGNATRNRAVTCLELDTLEEVGLSNCEDLEKPYQTQSCDLPGCLGWTTGEWSKCSVTCGHGMMTRNVECPEPNRCDPEEVLPGSQTCNAGECIMWVTGPWNKCSQTCGGGEQYRHLQCVNLVTQETAEGCDPSDKPGTTQDCNMEACPVQHQELQEEKTYNSQCTGDNMSHSICKALKKMGQCQQRYVQIKCCSTCHSVIAQQPNKNKRRLTS